MYLIYIMFLCKRERAVRFRLICIIFVFINFELIFLWWPPAKVAAIFFISIINKIHISYEDI